MSDSPAIITADRLPTIPDLPSEEKVREKFLARANPATEDQITTACWLLKTSRTLGLLSYGAIGRWIKISDATISKYLRGVYEADLAPLTARIISFREDWEGQQRLGETPFVTDLAVMKQITEFCELARFSRQVALIWGDSQTLKSETLRHIAKDESKDTIYIELEAGGTQRETEDALAEQCGISPRKASHEKWERIYRRIRPQTLTIVDEFHQAFVGRSLKMTLIERIRKIHDHCKSGLVLCGTTIFVEMLESPRFKNFLSQLQRRGVLRMYVPTKPMAGDFAKVVAAYRLPEPTDRARAIAHKIANEHGLGMLTKYFQVARGIAAANRVPLHWDHVLTTHDTFAPPTLR